ncbi:MAG: DUF1428 domain-containing protein [Pseudomonadota bacterium]
MRYAQMMVASVETTRRAAYIDHCKIAGSVFKEYGALEIVEAWGADVPDGTLTSFPMAVKKAEGETVVASWIVWPSKAAADAAWTKITEDPRMDPTTNPMPFDGKRLIFGGFDLILES